MTSRTEEQKLSKLTALVLTLFQLTCQLKPSNQNGGSFVAERREAARYRYQLRAVSEHRGIPETGHFVTYRRGVTDPHSWYLTNDDQVTRVPYSKVAACEAYMLYYERIQPSRWHRTPSYSLVPNLSL